MSSLHVELCFISIASQFLCETGLSFMEMKAAQPTALASEYTTREGNICFLQIDLRFKLCKCSRQNMSSTRTSESKTTCASQPFLHSINRCRALVISLQTSPMIKKLEIILPVTRASFLAETLLHDIISTTS